MKPLLYHMHHLLRSEDIPFWQKLVERYPGSILELGCGTGRVLLPLAALGYQATGLDNDTEMLAFFRKQFSPSQYSNLLLVEASMTTFQFSHQFDCIIVPCNTWSTLSSAERSAALQCIQAHLSLGGIFAFSVPNPTLLADLPASGAPEIEDVLIHPQSKYPVQIVSSWECTHENVCLYWDYQVQFPDGGMDTVSISAMHFLDSADKYFTELEGVGLTLFEKYGDYDWSVYNEDSTYLIVLATLEQNHK